MNGAGRRPRPAFTRRRRSVLLSTAVVGALLGGASQSSGAAGEPDTALAYSCLLPGGGQQPVAVTVAGDFPADGRPGRPLQPADATVALRLPAPFPPPPAPPPDGDAPAPADDGTVEPGGSIIRGATAALTVAVAQGEERTDTQWELTAEPAIADPEGAYPLEFTGVPPAVSAAAPGDVAFAAGELRISWRDAVDGTIHWVSCAPDGPDEGHPLAVVPVGEPDRTEPPTAPDPAAGGDDTPAQRDGLRVTEPPRQPALTGIDYGPAPPCPDEWPRGELDPDRLSPLPEGAERSETTQPVLGCTVALGFATVAKMDSALMINNPAEPAVMTVEVFREWWSADGGYIQIRHLGDLDLPDAESTFLTFGFMPTTAKVEFIAEPVTVHSVNQPGEDTYTEVGYHQHLRLYDVRVGGVPLEVGPDCRTAQPVDTALSATEEEYNVLRGGTLRGLIDIPPFTGCGDGTEDFSALFTASVSGSDNYIEINQSAICQLNSGCAVPDVPELPQH